MIGLRQARGEDEPFFLELRNEPLATRMSHRGPITPEQHAHYWKHTSDICIVITSDGRDVGLMRVQQDGTVSIIIHEGERGRGHGADALRLLPWFVTNFQAYPLVLYAEVLPENEPSQKAFLNAGWAPILFQTEVAQ